MMNKRKGKTSFDKSVSKFKTLIKSGPVFVCVVCNRCHYQKSVIFLKMRRYNVDEDSIFMVMSYDVIIIFVIRVIKHCETIECHVRQLQMSYM